MLTVWINRSILLAVGNHLPHNQPSPQTGQRGTLAQTRTTQTGPVGTNQSTTGQTTGGATTTAPTVAYGRQIVEFARRQMGQQVGDGECFALADQALRGAGAASAADFGVITADADYRWSSQRVQATDAQPGDIIQFRNFTVETRTDHADHSWQSNSESRPHHTAVVVSNDGAGHLTVLEQNVQIGGTSGQAQRSVRQNQIPIASSTTKNGDTTVTVRVGGTMIVYRPVARPASTTPTGTTHAPARPHGRH